MEGNISQTPDMNGTENQVNVQQPEMASAPVQQPVNTPQPEMASAPVQEPVNAPQPEMASAPVQEPVNTPQPNVYAQQPNMQQSQPNMYGQQPNMQQSQPNMYGQQPNMQQGQPNMYGQQPNMQQSQPNMYGQQPNMQQSQPNMYGQQPNMQQSQPNMYGQQPNMQQSQPNMYGQPAYGAVPPAQPVQKKKGGAKGIIIAIIVLLVALIGVGVWALITVFGNSPEARLNKGFQNWGKEVADYGSALGATLGWDEISKMLDEGASYTDISLDMTIPTEEIPTIGLDITSYCDMVNKLQNMDMAVSVSNMDLMKMQIAMDAEKVYIACPDLMENVYSIEMEDLGRKFNESIWAEASGMTLDEGLEYDAWAEVTEDVEDIYSEGFIEQIEADIEAISETLVVEETGEAIEIDRDGKKVVCDGISVVAEKEALNQLLDDIQDEIADGKYGESLKEALAESMEMGDEMDEVWDEAVTVLDGRFTSDMELVFYLDNKDRIVHIATPEAVKLDNSDAKVGFAVDFNGTERTLDDMNVMIKILGATAEDSMTISLNRYGNVEENIYSNAFEVTLGVYDAYMEEEQEILFIYSNEVDKEAKEFDIVLTISDELNEMEIEIAGAFDEIEQGKSFVLNLGSVNMVFDGETLFKCNGSVAIGPLEEEIEIPKDSVDFLSMTEEEVSEWIFEIMMNAEDMMSGFDF